MLNQVVLVGRLVSDPEITETEAGKKVSVITLAVSRSFKNINGEYETDFIDCIAFDTIAETTKTYCKKGDVVGIKGRLQKKDNEPLSLIAEKVTFLSNNLSTRKEEEE